MMKKSCCTPFQLRIPVAPFTMLLALHDTTTNANVSHDGKHNVVPHLDLLDLRNSVAPFMILSTSHVVNANGVIMEKVMLHLISIVLT